MYSFLKHSFKYYLNFIILCSKKCCWYFSKMIPQNDPTSSLKLKYSAHSIYSLEIKEELVQRNCKPHVVEVNNTIF